MNATELAGARVLVVEDDREIAELVATYLLKEGAMVDLAGSAEEAEAKAALAAPDLVLLDLGLPEADGFDFLRNFRAWSLAPVIIVSARESDEDKVRGLGLGADDFVSKPFSPRVLTARAQALLRRVAYGNPGPGRLEFGDLVLDLEGRFVQRRGQALALSRREFEVLAFLARHEGRTFTPAQLYASVWGLEHGDLSTVAVHIRRIRRKLEDDPREPVFLQTLPGQGYRFARPGV